MIVAVTGATGNLGRRVVANALAAGHSVRALVRPTSRVPGGWERVARVQAGDGPESSARALLEGVDVLVHLAAYGVQSRERDWGPSQRVNTADALGWTAAAHAHRVGRVVMTGSYFEYAGYGRLPDAPWPDDRPAPRCVEDASLEAWDPYSATKAAGGILARAHARAHHTALWYLRLASLYGPDDDPGRFIPSAVRAARSGERLPMSPGLQVRDWVHVDDAAEAVMACVGRPPPDGVETLNIGTGRGDSLLNLAARVVRLAGGDASLLDVGASTYRLSEVHHLVVDTARAEDVLGWRARIGLDEGLSSVVRAIASRVGRSSR